MFSYFSASQDQRCLPERVAYMRFTKYKSGVEEKIFHFNGLNIRFSVDYEIMGSFGGNRGEFSICNLNDETMKNFSNRFREVEFTNGNYLRLELFAGYKMPQMAGKQTVEQVRRIFDGSVLQTSATAPPDVWFNFSGITNYGRYIEPLEKTLTGGDKKITFQTVCKAVADYCDLDLIYEAKKEFTLKTYTISGTKNQAIRQLSEVSPQNFSIYCNESMRFMLVRDAEDALKKEEIEKFSNKWYISEDSGLIGIPQFSTTGAKIKILLNPSMMPNDIVELKTKSMPYWNGEYRIGRMKHTGELRGNDFCTHLELWNTKSTSIPFFGG